MKTIPSSSIEEGERGGKEERGAERHTGKQTREDRKGGREGGGTHFCVVLGADEAKEAGRPTFA
jgi:hypothetical protein